MYELLSCMMMHQDMPDLTPNHREGGSQVEINVSICI